jgi:hypothetical protein
MTTRIKLECPDTSHWHVKVDVQDQVYDHEAKAMTDEWREADSFVLKQTESRETYIHSSRRLIVTEIVPAS